MRRLPMLAVLLLAPCLASAEEARVDRIDIVDRGVYTIEAGTATADPSTPTGEVTAVETATIVEATTEIKARPGLEFGLRYVIVGEPAGAEASLDFVILYPEPGIRDPKEPEALHESRYTRAKKIGEPVYLGYGFENAWEIVPGTWTFQIWQGSRKLAEQSFTVAR
jgi:hypothetical protein